MPVNQSILVVGYGSLLSGYGLMAERRGGRSQLIARDAYPVVIENARRGLAKPSSHGQYLAMDLEPVDASAPIKVRIARGRGDPNEVGGLLLEFDREWAAKISTREEYDSATFLRLLEIADRAGRPLGEYLLTIAREAAFNLDGYRRELFAILGYTSPGYIFHPVPLDDGRVAIAAIGSGFHSSGHHEVISKRREFNLGALLTCGEALALSHLPMDREGQIGYFAECLLGGVHGIAVGDLMARFDVNAPWAPDLARHFERAATGERERFLRATGLDLQRYLERFCESPAPSLEPLLKMTAIPRSDSSATFESEMPVNSSFAIHVTKENLKFSAAHFIAYPGFREPLHGHNYQVGVRVEGKLAGTGYVIDFGLIKRIVKEIADRIDERTIVPERSDCLTIDRPNDRQVRIRYDSDEFILPASDVAMLPIVHSSAEELARYIWGELVGGLRAHGAAGEAEVIEISVAEGPGQAAIYRHAVD